MVITCYIQDMEKSKHYTNTTNVAPPNQNDQVTYTVHTKFLSWVWPDGTTGHMLTHHQLCWHEFSRRSNKPMRTEPHYSMLATCNLVSTSLTGVGLISSTYSQNPSVSVTTMRTDPSRSLQLHACRCRASGMPSVSEAFQLMLPFAPPHLSKNLLW